MPLHLATLPCHIVEYLTVYCTIRRSVPLAHLKRDIFPIESTYVEGGIAQRIVDAEKLKI